MQAYTFSIATERVWKSSFLKSITVENTGDETLVDFTVDVSTSAEVLKSWGGAYTNLGDGLYRLSFSDTSIEPGETATVNLKLSGTDDLALAETPEPEPQPDPDPSPTGITVAIGTTAAEFQAIVDAAEPGTVIQLEAGHYQFDSTISITTDGITLVGAGSDATIIECTGIEQEVFSIGDGARSGSYSLVTDVSEGTTTIELAGPHDFEVGDFVYLARESTEAFYDEIGDQTWRHTDVPLRTSILEVVAVEGAVLTLSGGVHFDFTVSETTVREVSMAEDITLGGFSIDYGLGTADPALFENTLPAYDRDAVIEVIGTDDLTLFDITAHNVPSLGINLARSTNVTADDIEITGAHNKGSGGNGYPIHLRDVYDSTFTNLTDSGMRHSVVFSSWNSAVGNLVHVSSTDRDINFHGGRDHDNTVYVDRSLRDADADLMSPTLFVNTEGTSYGSATDADANNVQFGHVIGTKRADFIQGYDAGAWLDGRAGNDTLLGGAGNDVLIGGAGDDQLDGGGGEDIAIFTGSFAAYTVQTLGSAVEIAGEGTDTLTGMSWALFDDGALRLDDMAFLDASTVEGIYSGAAAYDPETGLFVQTGEPVLELPPEPVAGPSVLYGTSGNDTFEVDEAGTVVWGLGGWDVVLSSVDFVMMDDTEKLELTGTAAIDGRGGENANILLGNAAANLLEGMGGDDRIWARGGSDVVDGGVGDDELHGGGGDDIIIGGSGADALYGDSGADTFLFRDLSDSPAGAGDQIVDFTTGQDMIDLSGIDADSVTEGHQAFVPGVSGAGALSIEGGVVSGDVDGDGLADFVIDLGGAAISPDDFIL